MRSEPGRRNAAVARLSTEWVVLAARPEPELVSRLLDRSVGERCGAVVAGAAPGMCDEEVVIAVRRAAWREVGGFADDVRGGAFAHLWARLQQAGWEVEVRPAPHTRCSGARAAAAAAWLRRLHAELPIPAGPRLAGRLAAARSNRLTVPRGSVDVAVLVDTFPELSETFIVAEARVLLELGESLRIEARARAARPNFVAATGLAVAYREDDTRPEKLRDLVWLVARHPLAMLRDLRDRGRWRAEERVEPLRALAPLARRLSRARFVHVHFADEAALDALRLAQIVGVPWSVIAHGHDIYKDPANLSEKLRAASFAATPCDYTVRDLRAVVGEDRADRVQRIVMGVDGDVFRRRTPYPGGRTLLAIGRLVEKKGFAYLIEAVAHLERREAVDELLVVGAGPLLEDLTARAHSLGVEHRVRLVGPLPPEEIRVLLEQRAACLVAPSVVAADGDRDSMPVVVKEALAMEIPVVASDEVGLPEVVRPEWGRLAPPGDAAALAEAIRELLSLPVERRAEMGRAGRRFVLAHCDVRTETERLRSLIDEARRQQPRLP